MMSDEHRAAAVRLLELADDYAAWTQWEAAAALARMADVHARLAQTPQPVTVAADPDAGLATGCDEDGLDGACSRCGYRPRGQRARG